MQTSSHLKTWFSPAAVLLAALLCMPMSEAAAQQEQQEQQKSAQQTRPTGLMAETILDLEIRTQSGEAVGEIENVLFDRNGRIREFLVDIGGFLGLGEKTVAVSTRELRFNPDRGFAVYQGTQSDLDNKEEVDYLAYGDGYPAYGPYYRPGYYPYGYPYYHDPYYGPYEDMRQFPPRGYYEEGSGRETGDMQRQRYEGRERAMRDQRMHQARRDRERRSMEGGSQYQYQQSRGRGDGRSDRLAMDRIIDASVMSPRGEDIGEVTDMIVSPRGRITHAIIEVGGFLDIGDKHVAVPFDKLENVGPHYVLYPGTEEQLESMPEFDAGTLRGDLRDWSGKMKREGRQAYRETRQEGRQAVDDARQEATRMDRQ